MNDRYGKNLTEMHIQPFGKGSIIALMVPDFAQVNAKFSHRMLTNSYHPAN